MEKFLTVYVERSKGIHGCLGPSDLMEIAVKLEETWFGLVLSHTFMPGIWHRGDLLRERFGLANLWLGGSWFMVHTCLDFSFINKISFSLIFPM